MQQQEEVAFEAALEAAPEAAPEAVPALSLDAILPDYAPLDERPGSEWRRPTSHIPFYKPVPVRVHPRQKHCVFAISGPSGTPDHDEKQWHMTFCGNFANRKQVRARVDDCKKAQPNAHYVVVDAGTWILMPPAQSTEEHEQRLAALFERMEAQRTAKDDQMDDRIRQVRLLREKIRGDIARTQLSKFAPGTSAIVGTNPDGGRIFLPPYDTTAGDAAAAVDVTPDSDAVDANADAAAASETAGGVMSSEDVQRHIELLRGIEAAEQQRLLETSDPEEAKQAERTLKELRQTLSIATRIVVDGGDEAQPQPQERDEC